MGLGLASALIPIVLAPVAAFFLWELVQLARPGYEGMRDPYRPEFYRWAVVILSAGIVVGWYAVLRRRIGPVAMVIGALGWPALLGAAEAWLAPALSYSDSLPAACAALGGLAALAIPDRFAAWRVVPVTLGIAPGVVLIVSAGFATLAALGLPLSAVAAYQFAVAGLLVLPLLELVMPLPHERAPAAAGAAAGLAEPGTEDDHARRRLGGLIDPVRGGIAGWRLGGAMFVMGLVAGLLGAGLAADSFDAEHPRPSHLMYVSQPQTDAAHWVSSEIGPGPWVTGHARHRTPEYGVGIPLPYRTEPRWSGSAPSIGAPAPLLDARGMRPAGDDTIVELHITSLRNADVLTLHADAPVEYAAVSIEGEEAVATEPAPSQDESSLWPYELRFYDPPTTGVQVTLRFPNSGPTQFALSDFTVRLEDVPGYRPRLPHIGRSTQHSSDTVVVGGLHKAPAAR